MLVNMFTIALLMPAQFWLQYSHSPFSVIVGSWRVLVLWSHLRFVSLVRSQR